MKYLSTKQTKLNKYLNSVTSFLVINFIMVVLTGFIPKLAICNVVLKVTINILLFIWLASLIISSLLDNFVFFKRKFRRKRKKKVRK